MCCILLPHCLALPNLTSWQINLLSKPSYTSFTTASARLVFVLMTSGHSMWTTRPSPLTCNHVLFGILAIASCTSMGDKEAAYLSHWHCFDQFPYPDWSTEVCFSPVLAVVLQVCFWTLYHWMHDVSLGQVRQCSMPLLQP